MPDKMSWIAAGATIAEQDKQNDSRINLRDAFNFLCDEFPDLDPENPEEVFSWFEWGYNAYWDHKIVRKPVDPNSKP